MRINHCFDKNRITIVSSPEKQSGRFLLQVKPGSWLTKRSEGSSESVCVKGAGEAPEKAILKQPLTAWRHTLETAQQSTLESLVHTCINLIGGPSLSSTRKTHQENPLCPVPSVLPSLIMSGNKTLGGGSCYGVVHKA